MGEFDNQFGTPCIASKIVDDLGIGSILKHVNDDSVRAIIIDWIGSAPDCVAIVVDTESSDEQLETDYAMDKFRPDYYEVKIINLKKFIALTRGSDEMLIP